MNILVITEKDAANASISKIANALLKNGHKIRVYAPYYTEKLLNGFDEKIEKYPFSSIGKEAYDWCDMIFSTSIAAGFLKKEELLRINKPIFTHNYLINGQVNWGGDLCFVSSLETAHTDYDSKIIYSNFAIGEPKYDSIDNNQKKEEKKFLFIDSGHFPFGKKGKEELAECLLDICNSYPEYELVIKPRFLPGDTVITHRNLFTLYDAIMEKTRGALPDNLNYLNQHYDLIDLIEESNVVLCLYTTAFVGAYVANKGLVILDGIESEDVYDVRLKSFMRIRKNMECTNAIVNYKNVKDYLPKGVESNAENMKQLFAEQENVSDKICEVVEYLYNEYYLINKFPLIGNYNYVDFKTCIKESKNDNWDVVIDRRLRNYILQRMLIHIDFNISAGIDTSYIEEYVNKIDFTKTTFEEEMKNVSVVRSKCIIKNSELMLQDKIDAGILLNAYYILKEYESIINFPKKEISAYFLFLAFTYFDNDDNENALINLEKYFSMTDGRDYIEEITDMSGNRFRAFKTIIMLYEENENAEKVKHYVDKMTEYYKINFLVNDIYEETKSVGQKNILDFIKKYQTE